MHTSSMNPGQNVHRQNATGHNVHGQNATGNIVHGHNATMWKVDKMPHMCIIYFMYIDSWEDVSTKQVHQMTV